MNSKTNREKILLSAKKLVDDKKAVRAYLRGEKKLNDLNDKGIKLAMPV